MIIVGTRGIILTIAIVSSAHTSTNVVVTKEKKMTNKEASNVLRLFANLIEINGLPEERILTFRKAYEQAITELESDKRPQGEWIEKVERRGCFAGDKTVYSYTCPFCGVAEFKKYPFCHCGADMRGKEK